MGNRQVRTSGIDIHRRDIHFGLGRHFLVKKAAKTMGGKSHAALELHRNPFGILPHRKRETLGINLNASLITASVKADIEVGAKVVTCSQRTFGTRNVRMKARAVAFDGNPYPAFAELVLADARCAETKRALTSL